jgi:lysophospholipase L1-like esterase
VPPDTKDGPEIPPALVERNKIAAKIMQQHHIPIDDLYTWMLPDLDKYQNKQDVHFNAPGYARLSDRVARVIDTQLPPVPGVNKAIVPSGKIETDGYNWEERHAAVMAAKATFKPEYVLIGDSITHFWGGEPDGGHQGNRGADSWQSLFGEHRALNLGFGWDRTQNVLKRIELGELDGLDPKAVIIHIGTNNLAKTVQSHASTAPQIAEAIGVIVDRVQAKCPHAQVILMSIFPRGKGPANPQRDTINDVNQRLAALAQKPRVTVLNITDKWLGPDGAVTTDLMPDSLHPNAKGYAVWAAALQPVLPH